MKVSLLLFTFPLLALTVARAILKFIEYGAFEAHLPMFLNGAMDGCFDALGKTMDKAVQSSKISGVRVRPSTACGKEPT
ncbi:hypothetical protein BGZ82_001128 [Podila clonocystis]|nr:hypothetical protein BGZ82_001128 [Podila clonocystis]